MTTKTPRLIVVIPCYNEEKTLPATGPMFAEALADLVASGKISNESRILFVDDGSGDGTWQVIKDFADRDPRFMGIRPKFQRREALRAGGGIRCFRIIRDAPASRRRFVYWVRAQSHTRESSASSRNTSAW